jgi:putative flippase GtrA
MPRHDDVTVVTPLVERDERERLVRFVVVGGTNTLVALLGYTLLVGVGAAYPVAATIGYAAGILNGYTWNRLWTFETGAFHLPEFSRYVVVQGSGLAANLLGLVLLVETVGLGKVTAEAISVVPIVLVTYSLNRWWTFRPRPPAGSARS